MVQDRRSAPRELQRRPSAPPEVSESEVSVSETSGRFRAEGPGSLTCLGPHGGHFSLDGLELPNKNCNLICTVELILYK